MPARRHGARSSASIANAVGTVEGMIGGQVLDLESEHLKPTPELVEAIHRAKTGALIRVSVVAGGVYAGANADDVARLDRFGRKAGLAFQIVDDVLDMTVDSAHLGKTAGKDQATEKATWPAVYGIEQSRRDAAAADRRSLRRAGALRRAAPRASNRWPATWWSGRTEKQLSAVSCQLSAFSFCRVECNGTRPINPSDATVRRHPCRWVSAFQGGVSSLSFRKVESLFNVTWAGKNRQQCALP